ncbi:endopeptidase La [Patescibacteria group bacterium]
MSDSNSRPIVDNIRRQLPIVAVRGTVVFPNTDPVLTFGRKKSVAAINAAFKGDKVIAIFSQKDIRTQNPDKKDLNQYGVIATINQMMPTEGEVHAVVRGQTRAKLHSITSGEPFLIGKVEEAKEDTVVSEEIKILSDRLAQLFKKSINLGKQAEIMTVMKLVSGQVNPNELVNQIATLLDVKSEEKQKILEINSLKQRILKVTEHLGHEVNVLDLERSISVKTQKRFENQMRKAMLREKKRTIEQELGEETEELGSEEVKMFRKKIKDAKMPKDVRKKALKELQRLARLNPQSPETGYIRNYLEWLTDMPWSKYSSSDVSIKKASKVLDEDHYGLKKPKERILEYLSVMKIKEGRPKKKSDVGSQPTILCFIGPPGVGKTSIGKSIARSMGRKFVRVSLGGIRDEAEIRGHRRTYVGALPGRIIQGIKNAGTKNPVFMLDEVDKLGVDFRGDPSSALLEALDPEQNREFSDHYLEVPFDLSDVMFIATGNMLDTIPEPLKDRMEIIRFAGYTEDEKYEIARKYLIPKQLKVHGLDKQKIRFQKSSIYEIINRYTREAGVRNLERNLAKVMRKFARMVAEKKKFGKSISKKDIRKYLGPHQFSSLIAEKKDEIGMATGLAVTPAGGEILFIEVALMPGKGRLTLTGKLGDVMKESAKAAFTWVKSHWHELGLREDFAKRIDVHVHVPEGAVPKDGPSAGVTLSTALVSALTGISVRRDVGMTGEITLRGRVLQIGGVKEKAIAAHRAGLKTVILPAENKKDMEDIPANVKRDIKFVHAAKFEDVLKIAMKSWPPKTVGKSRNNHTPIPSFIAAN